MGQPDFTSIDIDFIDVSEDAEAADILESRAENIAEQIDPEGNDPELAQRILDNWKEIDPSLEQTAAAAYFHDSKEAHQALENTLIQAINQSLADSAQVLFGVLPDALEQMVRDQQKVLQEISEKLNVANDNTPVAAYTRIKNIAEILDRAMPWINGGILATTALNPSVDSKTKLKEYLKFASVEVTAAVAGLALEHYDFSFDRIRHF